MDIDASEDNTGLKFTEEAKLRHDNKYLQERLINLEKFKKNFFNSYAELQTVKSKLALYEQQISLEKVKDKISGLPDNMDAFPDFESLSNDGVLAFFNESFSASKYQDVVASIFHSVKNLELDVSVQVNLNGEILNHALNEDSKIENIQLIEFYKTRNDEVCGDSLKKVQQVDDDYIVFNLSHLSLLAKNLPIQDKQKTEDIIEFLKIVSIGANSKFALLHRDSEYMNLQKNIYQVFTKTRQSFELMRDNIDNQIISISEMYLEFEKKLDNCLKDYNLNSENTSQYKLIISEARSELNLLLTSGLTFDEDFLNTIIKLEKSYSSKFDNVV